MLKCVVLASGSKRPNIIILQGEKFTTYQHFQLTLSIVLQFN